MKTAEERRAYNRERQAKYRATSPQAEITQKTYRASTRLTVMRGVLVGLLLLAGTVGVCADNFVVIGNDLGGDISKYIEKYDAIRRSGVTVILVADCVSACTLVLTLPRSQVCATPGARLGFHGVSRIPGGPVDHAASRKIGEMFYPVSVRQYLQTHVVHFEPATKFFRPCRA